MPVTCAPFYISAQIYGILLFKESYIYLFNKYKEQIENANSREKILIIGNCKNSEEYSQLTLEEQDKLFYDLMSIKRR